jgi:hypothetical protein
MVAQAPLQAPLAAVPLAPVQVLHALSVSAAHMTAMKAVNLTLSLTETRRMAPMI